MRALILLLFALAFSTADARIPGGCACQVLPVASTPTFSPVGGSYSSAQTVTISTATSGATIYYTTNGSTPTTASPQYTVPITVNSTETIKALAAKSGYTNSSVGSATYTISSSLPTCSTGSVVGTLSLSATTPRSAGVSPLLVFFDATATTDSAIANNMTPFQDIYYSWSFGDTGSSGTGTWAYGSNPGGNSKNLATGGVAAHLYNVADGAGDQNYTVTLTATDGSNTAQCTIPVTVYDPSGSNGFTATTCVFSGGSLGSGCPSGSGSASQSSFVTAISTYGGTGKRVLFKCGDTFTGDNAIISATKMSIGAYGSCPGTQTNRPVLSDTGTTGILTISGTDERVADLDLEGNNNSGSQEYAVSTPSYTYPGVTQFTLYNTYSNGTEKGFYWTGNQVGAVQYYMNNFGSSGLTEGTFGLIGNSCTNGNTTYQCGQGSGAVYNNNNYQAVMGSYFSGPSGGAGVYETVRITACQKCTINNNTSKNAGSSYAVLKMHSSNPSSQETWIGQYTQLVEISDNFFAGASGGFFVELAPQNSSTDERIRNVVVERNVYAPASTTYSMVLSGDNITFRDNVLTSAGGTGHPIQFFRRGVEWNYAAPTNPDEPQYLEAYNNTCNGQSQCIQLNSPAHNCFAQNNLFYDSGGGTVVSNSCTTSTVSNNTSTTTANPNFTDPSSTFLDIGDYKPTANYSGGTSIPNFYDALGTAWSPTWDLGAVHH
jgi:hypothetical protein